MPRKAKEKIDEIEIIDEKKVVAKKSTTKKASAEKKETKKTTKTTKSASKKVASSEKKEDVTKKASDKKVATKKASAAKGETKKSTTAKKSAVKAEAKKATTKKASAAKEETKVDVSKDEIVIAETPKKTRRGRKPASDVKESSTTKTKSTTSKSKKESSSKKTSSPKKVTRKTTKKTSSEQENIKTQVAEYYDLPYKYGNTVVKLLAQTPQTLFVYWEVADSDIENFRKLYGDDFFTKTRPILIIHNLTLNKTSEIEINDFANCWYLNTEDTDCKFDIELARKFVDTSSSQENNETDYLPLASSNNLQSPNDHILFEKIKNFVVFRNVSNDNVIKKNVKSFKFLRDIYKFYKDMYDEEVLNNPSSQFKF